ncbi:MAG: phosphoribosylanthranilate isomerase [Lentisphaeria bacterium]|nr:phosphoribosylanthranilate isomerase [Lentisphaeria bacterium]
MLLKLCGITRPEDMAAAEHAGAAYAGMILVPGTPRFVPRERIPVLMAAARCKKVFIVRDMPLAELNALIAEFRPYAVQLHGNESADYAQSITGTVVWRAFNLHSEAALAEAEAFPCALVVADSGGGTGRPCRWDLAARLASVRQVLLGGGITPDNVREAVAQVRPAGIDVSSGVESAPGIKDHLLIQKLAERIQI